MKLRTDQKFTMYDESYLFDCMGLTKTTSEELNSTFNPKITSFLQQNQLVKADPAHKKQVVAVSKAQSKLDDVSVADAYEAPPKVAQQMGDDELFSQEEPQQSMGKTQAYQQQNQ